MADIIRHTFEVMLGALPLVISDINKVMENEAYAGRKYKLSDAFFNL